MRNECNEYKHLTYEKSIPHSELVYNERNMKTLFEM